MDEREEAMEEVKKIQADEQMFTDAIAEIAKKGSPKLEGGIENIGNNLQQGMLPKDALGVQDGDIENIYAHAYQLYGTGKYEEAKKIFAALVVVDPTDERFLFGHAACSHMQGEFEDAAHAYMNHALFTKDDPVSYYHAADCYMKLDDKLSAAVCFNLAIKRAGNREEYKLIKDRSEMAIQKFKEEGVLLEKVEEKKK